MMNCFCFAKYYFIDWYQKHCIDCCLCKYSKKFDSLYDYFISNKLLTSCQSGFIKGDSCVNQLVAITHEIHKSLAQGFNL